METIAKIRRMYYVQKKGFKTIARELKLSRNTVKKIIHEDKTIKQYIRTKPVLAALKPYVETLLSKLEANQLEPTRRKKTATKIYRELCELGFKGHYTTVNTFIQKWKQDHHQSKTKVYIPLEFSAGEAFQFDWSYEEIELKGRLTKVKAAHIRLCYSCLFLIMVYPNEQLEMVMDAHDKAFQFFEGSCEKGIYDNMKTVIQTVLMGKDRIFNRRFLEMASHYLFNPIACTPAAGWEKGQVENQVGTSRRNFFTPLHRVNNLEELNAKLQEDCIQWAKDNAHPEFKEKTVWEVYQEEKRSLIPYRHQFDACKIQTAVLSPYSLVHYQTNAYSACCEYVGKVVEMRIYANKILIAHGNQIIGEHARCFEKGRKIYEPIHYVPALAYKPGALRNGAPFKHWSLPKPLTEIQKKLCAYSDGDKQFIQILLQLPIYGLESVTSACMKALNQGTYRVEFVMASLQPAPVLPPEEGLPQLKEAPDSECTDYNQLLNTWEVTSYAA